MVSNVSGSRVTARNGYLKVAVGLEVDCHVDARIECEFITHYLLIIF